MPDTREMYLNATPDERFKSTRVPVVSDYTMFANHKNK